MVTRYVLTFTRVSCHARLSSIRTGTLSDYQYPIYVQIILSDKSDCLDMGVSYHDNKTLSVGAGAFIPPELFSDILLFVSYDDRRHEVQERFRREEKPLNDFDADEMNKQIDEAGPTYALKTCSLVCLHWANQCRRYMFYERTLTICSFEDAQTFRHYSTLGSARLTPIYHLVQFVAVWQNYRDARSLIDVVFLPGIRHKLQQLHLDGAAQHRDGPLKSASSMLHRHLPNFSTISPSISAYSSLSMVDFFFPSFSYVAKFLRHFRDTEYFYFESLRWNTRSVAQLMEFAKPAGRHREDISIRAKCCTDNLALCLQTAVMFPDHTLRMVHEWDRHWITNAMECLRECCRYEPAYGEFLTRYSLDCCKSLSPFHLVNRY
jgi:hypothetical protein